MVTMPRYSFEVERSKIKIKDATMPKSFVAITPAQMFFDLVQVKTNIPILGQVFVPAVPSTVNSIVTMPFLRVTYSL